MCLDDLEYLNLNKFDGINLFVYCENDSVNLIDYEGTSPISIKEKNEREMYLLADNFNRMPGRYTPVHEGIIKSEVYKEFVEEVEDFVNEDEWVKLSKPEKPLSPPTNYWTYGIAISAMITYDLFKFIKDFRFGIDTASMMEESNINESSKLIGVIESNSHVLSGRYQHNPKYEFACR